MIISQHKRDVHVNINSSLFLFLLLVVLTICTGVGPPKGDSNKSIHFNLHFKANLSVKSLL